MTSSPRRPRWDRSGGSAELRSGAVRAAYAAAGALARAAAVVAPAGEGKLGRTLRARRGIRERYTAWAAAHREPRRPLLWIHAPSVGEGLQARPVIELVRRERPEVQIAYTYFSPSAARFAESLDADFTDYLPFDTTGDAAVILDALRPAALVFSKLDVWPVLAETASRRGVRLGMISATLASGSGRRSRLARTLLHDAYGRLDAVGAISADDAARLVAVGVRHHAVTVTGDTRYDQVSERAARADRAGPLLAPFLDAGARRPTLVAGSTWPADERVLFGAWHGLRTRFPTARIVIAPHEPTAAHVAPVESWARNAGLSLARLGTTGAPAADVVLVDRVGVLGDLYAVADVAYVGGGFHAAGLHSVLEPAAFGVPVLVGPRHQESRDAGLVLAAGGAAAVTTAAELEARLAAWFGDDGARAVAGGAARRVVTEGLGAARRSYELVARLLG